MGYRTIAALLAAPLLACGGTSEVTTDPEPSQVAEAAEAAEAAPAMAPPPFRAAEIRAATRAGDRYIYRVDAPGEAPHTRETRWVAAGEGEATFEVHRRDDDGSPLGQVATIHATWLELEGHASHWPAADTTIKRGPLTTPAGTFDAIHYTVVDRTKGQVTQAWFAAELPGAPVLFHQQTPGAADYRMELIEVVRPRPAAPSP